MNAALLLTGALLVLQPLPHGLPGVARTLRTAAAAPAPTVTVRGTTRLELEKMQRVQGGVMVTLRLVDADLGEGIEGKSVTLSISRYGQEVFQATRTTSKKGSAQIMVPHQKGEYDLKLDYSGGPLYAASAPAVSSVDLSKEAIQLTMSAPPRVDVGGRPFPVVLTARHHAPIPGVQMILVARRGDKEIQRRSGETNAEGEVRIQLEPGTLGGPGELLLMARSRATSTYNAARTSHRMFLLTATTVTLRFDRKHARKDVGLKAQGVVTDASGPVLGGVVHLYAAGHRVATVRTGMQGKYAVKLSLRHLPLGRMAVRAHFVPRTAWRRASRSRPAVVLIEPAKPIPIWYFLAPALATVLFLLVILAIRRKPWRALQERFRAKRETQREEKGGIELGRRRSLRGLFSVDLHSVNGTVIDNQEGTPLVGATIYLRAPEEGAEDRQTRSAADGTFALQEVPAGTWNLVITAPGWIPQSRLVAVPHRGELHGLLVRLHSVRRRVMDIYAEAVRPMLPDPELVRYWTPSETTDAVAERVPQVREGLAELTALTEQTYYDPEVPDVEVVKTAEELAHTAGKAAVEEAKREAEERSRRDSVMEEPLE